MARRTVTTQLLGFGHGTKEVCYPMLLPVPDGFSRYGSSD